MWPCVLAVVLSAVASAAQIKPPIVDTPLGRVSGSYLVSRAGRTFAAFNKIPFAEPPVGELRFQPPVPIGKWNGTYNASGAMPTCAQIESEISTFRGVEDCLYLSVFTHNISGKAPVLVHIHGGAFAGGDAINQPNFLMDENIVIVRVSYRVGILGFLSFEDDILPGNQGMKDQVEALKWVKANIASFGGDSKLVTIIGESAGGACVYHHTVSPLSKGLFHRAIAESGTSYAVFALGPPGYGKSLAIKVLQNLNCSTDDSKLGLSCLLKKNAFDVVSQYTKLLLWEYEPEFQFGPVLEKEGPNAFLSGPISEWKHEPVPLLMGVCSAEGLFKTLEYYNRDWKTYTENFNKIAPITLGYFSSASNPDEVTKQIRQYYLKNPNITLNDWVNLTTVYTDFSFTIPAIDGANKHIGDVFFYYFDYILKAMFPWAADKLLFGENTLWVTWANVKAHRICESQVQASYPLKTPLFLNVACCSYLGNEPKSSAVHTTESLFLWDMGLISTKEEIDLSIKLVRIVSNFMTYGTPARNGSELQTWDKWVEKDKNYMQITREGLFVQKKDLAPDRYNFWKTVNYRDNYEKNSTGNLSSRISSSMWLLSMVILVFII